MMNEPYRPVVTLNCKGMSSDETCNAIFETILQREHERYEAPLTPISLHPSPDDAPSSMPFFLPEISTIKMGAEVFHNALRFSYNNHMVMVDYCDGHGERPCFWGRACDLDLDMNPHEVQLS